MTENPIQQDYIYDRIDKIEGEVNDWLLIRHISCKDIIKIENTPFIVEGEPYVLTVITFEMEDDEED